ncbi:hypothetical protein [Haloferax volcanii]|uniref:hypothetical protein n=1 Tax=Haloferax volcanii TaxID=2246 RepID=UPI00249BAE93|nr:hypothetical protein [Haloferax alexandrinus]
MTRLAALYSGTAPQRRTLLDSEYARYVDEVVHVRDLSMVDLSAFDRLLVPSRLHLGALHEGRDAIFDFLDGGGDAAVFGGQPDPWLPELSWTHRPTNFWWWLDSDGDSGLRFPRDDHPFFEAVPPRDCTWHFHGAFDAPADADVLVTDVDGDAVLYLDRETWTGDLVATTLDPTYHYGSYFMPATDRFLAGFLPWFRDEF